MTKKIISRDDAAPQGSQLPPAVKTEILSYGGSSVDIAATIHAATAKSVPVDADEVPVVDSAATFGLKKTTFANLKTWVRSWIAKADVGLSNVNNTADDAKPISTAAQTALNLKAPLASPAFTGTPTGITKTHVGLSNVDNTSDATKLADAVRGLVWSGTAWPDRPNDNRLTIFSGGASATDGPTDADKRIGDLWIPAS